MPKSNPAQINFTRGQLSKKMRGRNDLDFYYSGTERQVNFISDVQGSASFKKGTIFLGETKDNNKAYLFEFIFSETDAYAMEFTDQRIRFWTADGLVTGGGADIASPYLEADIPELQMVQQADTIYIAHKNYFPQILVRTGANTFTINNHVITEPASGDMDWSDADNYPGAVGIYERRLMYAGSNNNPQVVFGSKSFLYDDFTQGTGADDGFQYLIGATLSSRIRWIIGTRSRAVIGTASNVFDMDAGTTNQPITPTTVRIVPSSNRGVKERKPVQRDNTILYIQSGSDVINSYEFSLESNSFVPIDRTILSDDITDSGVDTISFANGNPDFMYGTLNNGEAIGLTWKPEQKVFGWTSLQTDGDYISFSSVPQPIGGDRVIQCVLRDLDGTPTYMIEVSAPEYTLPEFENFFTGDKDLDTILFQLASYEAQKAYVHVDSGLTFDGSARGVSAGANLTMTFAAVGASTTVTASASVFLSTDVGNQIRVKLDDADGWGEITTFTSGTSVVIKILTEFRQYDEDDPLQTADPSTWDEITALAAGAYYITADSFTGLAHLEAETCAIIIDGAEGAQRTVTSGSLTLSDDGKTQGAVVHIGRPYTGILQTMNIQPPQASPASKKLVMSADILFLQSLGATYGTDIYRTSVLPFQSTGNRTSRPPLPFSGYKCAKAPSRTEDIKRVVILQKSPLPCIIQQIVPDLYNSN